MAPVMQNLAAHGYPIQRVDAQREPELVRQYGVDAFPTFIMLVEGRVVDREVGAANQDRILQMFQRAQASHDVAASEASGDTFRGQSPNPQSDPNRFPGQPTQYAIAGSSAAPNTQAPRNAAAGDAFTAGLVQSTVRVRVDDPDGHSYGTGTVIDSRSGEALVLTCGHLFRDSHGKGRIVVDVMVDGVVRAVEGQLITYDEDRDLGFISIRPSGAVHASRVAAPQRQASIGDRVWSVGCNGGAAPTVEATRVTNIDRYTGPPNIEIFGMPVEGRSGGGLFNEQGEVIGVCNGADAADNEGLYAAVGSIHAELDRLGLSDVYRASPQAEFASHQTPPDMSAVGTDSGLPDSSFPNSSEFSFNSIDDGNPNPRMSTSLIGPSPSVPVAGERVSLSGDPLDNLSPNERTMLAELSARSAGGQVICIIQPATPGAKSEIVILNNASETLLEQLAELRSSPSNARLTSLNVEGNSNWPPSVTKTSERTVNSDWEPGR